MDCFVNRMICNVLFSPFKCSHLVPDSRTLLPNSPVHHRSRGLFIVMPKLSITPTRSTERDGKLGRVVIAYAPISAVINFEHQTPTQDRETASQRSGSDLSKTEARFDWDEGLSRFCIPNVARSPASFPATYVLHCEPFR